MKASHLSLLVLSWLPSLAAQAFETERPERAVLPLELAAVTLTPTEPSAFPSSVTWGLEPLQGNATDGLTTFSAEPVVPASLHPAPAVSIAELFKTDPLGVAVKRSHVPEPTSTALFGAGVLAAFACGRHVRRQRRTA